MCSRSFIRFSRQSLTWIEFRDFFRFIRGRINRAHILAVNNWSRPTLSVPFGKFLDHPIVASEVWDILPPITSTTPRDWVYGCDGKWLGRAGVFFIHRNVITKENLWWSFMVSETYEAIGRDCKSLRDRLDHHLPMGAVSDWKGSIVAAVTSHFGNIPHQRCLAHVTRAAKRFLPLNSPFEATKKLRWIAKSLMLLETHRDPSVWQRMLIRWEKQYGYMLTEKTQAPMGETRHWWYTHGNLRRAWRLLTYDQNPLFMFLINPLIPNTNNALEGVNSNLKQKLGDHRGMKVPRQAAFLSWYMAFTRVNTEKDLKKLWGWWKSKFSRN